MTHHENSEQSTEMTYTTSKTSNKENKEENLMIRLRKALDTIGEQMHNPILKSLLLESTVNSLENLVSLNKATIDISPIKKMNPKFQYHQTRRLD